MSRGEIIVTVLPRRIAGIARSNRDCEPAPMKSEARTSVACSRPSACHSAASRHIAARTWAFGRVERSGSCGAIGPVG